MRKRILMIATGGTIASLDSGDGLKPEIQSEELLKYIPEVEKYCEADTLQLMNLDSTNVTPEHWLKKYDSGSSSNQIDVGLRGNE